ncbi:hypothetical protein Taro_015832 [Colocasia esculenta]|uniref:Uncharacterized protein n=1 Tax=Colocasia esculenta TaxID=4460 RepID=A0A843UUD8_COLES|nr:hypothetical protein [Colocasia esculenta]
MGTQQERKKRRPEVECDDSNVHLVDSYVVSELQEQDVRNNLKGIHISRLDFSAKRFCVVDDKTIVVDLVLTARASR